MTRRRGRRRREGLWSFLHRAAAHPERYPFERWLEDEVAEAACAMNGGTP